MSVPPPLQMPRCLLRLLLLVLVLMLKLLWLLVLVLVLLVLPVPPPLPLSLSVHATSPSSLDSVVYVVAKPPLLALRLREVRSPRQVQRARQVQREVAARKTKLLLRRGTPAHPLMWRPLEPLRSLDPLEPLEPLRFHLGASARSTLGPRRLVAVAEAAWAVAAPASPAAATE